MLRVGTAAAGFHHLPNQTVKGFFFTAAILVDHRLVFGNDLFDDGFNRACIGFLLKPFFFDDFISSVISIAAFALIKRTKDFFSYLPDKVSSLIRASMPANCLALIGESAMSLSSLLRAPSRSPMTQLAAILASCCPTSVTTFSK